jgi:chromosome partitioning protein
MLTQHSQSYGFYQYGNTVNMLFAIVSSLLCGKAASQTHHFIPLLPHFLIGMREHSAVDVWFHANVAAMLTLDIGMDRVPCLQEATMAVITLCSAKGGVGKTTMAVNIAAEMALRGVSCALVDCDLNQHATQFGYDFSKFYPDVPLVFHGETNKNNIVANIKKASEGADVVIVDLPAGASELSLRAVMKSHLVVIPSQKTVFDAKDAIKTAYHIAEASELSDRQISSIIVWSMVGSQFETKTERLVRLGMRGMLLSPDRAISSIAMLRYDVFQSGFAHGFVPRQVAPHAGEVISLSTIQKNRNNDEKIRIPPTAVKAAETVTQIVNLLLSRINDIAAGRNSYIAINHDVIEKIQKEPQEAL